MCSLEQLFKYTSLNTLSDAFWKFQVICELQNTVHYFNLIYKIIQNSVHKTVQSKILKHYYNTMYVVLCMGA